MALLCMHSVDAVNLGGGHAAPKKLRLTEPERHACNADSDGNLLFGTFNFLDRAEQPEHIPMQTQRSGLERFVASPAVSCS